MGPPKSQAVAKHSGSEEVQLTIAPVCGWSLAFRGYEKRGCHTHEHPHRARR
jgi:hypothetical protein